MFPANLTGFDPNNGLTAQPPDDFRNIETLDLRKFYTIGST